MMQLKESTADLRVLVEQHLGKPLAVSTKAALWRCPVCPRAVHSLLMISCHEHRCLGCLPCDGGAIEWMHDIVEAATDLVVSRESL
jgi:hypothetical protein